MEARPRPKIAKVERREASVPIARFSGSDFLEMEVDSWSFISLWICLRECGWRSTFVPGISFVVLPM